jgi:hypothetical protein
MPVGVRIKELVQQLLASEAADSVVSSDDNKNAYDNSTDAGGGQERPGQASG